MRAKYSKKAGYKFMDEREFNQLKAMLEAKIPSYRVKDLTGRSSGLLNKVSNAKDFESYKKGSPKESTPQKYDPNLMIFSQATFQTMIINRLDTIIKLLKPKEEPEVKPNSSEERKSATLANGVKQLSI